MIYSTALLLLLLSVPEIPQRQSPVEIAQAQFESGNYTSTVKTLNAALASAPQDASIHYWLARAYYELQDFDRAVTSAEQAVKLSPQSSEYNRWLGRAYGGKAEKSHSFLLARKVKKSFETAVRLAPQSIEARRDLMQYCVEAPWVVGGSNGTAREQIEAISKLNPLEGKLARAAYLAADKQWKAAETEYLNVLLERPGYIKPYIEAAEFFRDRKDSANLDRTLEAAAHLGSKDPRLQY